MLIHRKIKDILGLGGEGHMNTTDVRPKERGREGLIH